LKLPKLTFSQTGWRLRRLDRKMITVMRTGVDIVEIARLDTIQPRIRARFIERVYTPRELLEVGQSTPSLAGRFAAKEAVSKALGTGIGRVHWKDIEIQRGPRGEPVLVLYGAAQQTAEQLGLTIWSVSISHGREHAVAMVVAVGESERWDVNSENPLGQ
jgi:holo-[acyl-carrier protein] synthase